MNPTPTPEDLAAVKRLCLEYGERLTKAEKERDEALRQVEQLKRDREALNMVKLELHKISHATYPHDGATNFRLLFGWCENISQAISAALKPS